MADECHHPVMDAIDRQLLTLLLADARTTYQELGRAVRLSANTVAERVRRLRSVGVIRGYHADLDRAEFERGLTAVPNVLSAMRLTGEYDYQLRVACADAAEFETVIDRLKREHGVRELRSRLLLHEVPLGSHRLLA